MQVNIRGNIKDSMAKLVYECVFCNSTEHPINPTHFLSLDENSTVCDVTLQVGDKLLHSEIKEKIIAQQLYNKAVEEGKLGTIFKEISKTEYKLSFCNLLSNEVAIIKISFNSYLQIDGEGFYKFFIPTNIAMKYSLNQATEMTYSSDFLLNYNFDITWSSVHTFLEVIGNAIQLDEKTIQICGNTIPRNGDFIVRVKTSNIPSIYYYQEKNIVYGIANIKVGNSENNSTGKNFNIIVDCSGSMSEKIRDKSKIVAARESVVCFLRKLKPCDYFNVIMFGSFYKSVFSNSVVANEQNISFILNRLNDLINSDMGGTELTNCLEDCLCDKYLVFDILTSKRCSIENEKIIIVITDGQIYNSQNLFNKISYGLQIFKEVNAGYRESTLRPTFRIFSIGVGNSVDRNLVKEISTRTNGDFFCTIDSEKIVFNIEIIMSYIQSSYYINANFPSSVEMINNFPVLYPNKNYMFGFKMDVASFQKNDFCIKCESSKSGNIISCKIKKEFIINSNDVSIKQFYYNLMINKYEDKLAYDNLPFEETKEIENKIVKLSIEGKIMSSKTAFLIVDSVSRTTERSENYTIPNYRCEDIDCLDGGMDMFGGSSRSIGYRDGFVPYNTEAVFSDNPTFEDICYKSRDDLLKDMQSCDITDENLFCRIVIYMKFRKNKKLDDFLHATLIFSLSPSVFLLVEKCYNRYILSLISENNQNMLYSSHYCDY